MPDMTERLLALKQQVGEADRQRAQAEAQLDLARQRLTEIDQQIAALGVKPDKAEVELEKLEGSLQAELAAIEEGLRAEAAAYRAILAAAK